MKYCADTWFLLKLIEKDDKAIQIRDEIIEGKSRLLIPTIVIAELVREMVMKGKLQLADEIIRSLQTSAKIIVVDLTQDIAKEAGKYGVSFNLPLVDSIIMSSAIILEHTTLLTSDDHYKLAEKKGKIKRMFW